MYIFTKLLQITLLLFASLSLHIVPWVPSLLIENIVNLSIIMLFILSAYLVYLVMKEVYASVEKKNIYLGTIYTLILFSYVGFFAIVHISISLDKSKYLQVYTFEKSKFYTYLNENGTVEISIQENNSLLRSLPIASFDDKNIKLAHEEEKVYVVSEKNYTPIYDTKNKHIIKNLKEKNE